MIELLYNVYIFTPEICTSAAEVINVPAFTAIDLIDAVLKLTG